MLSLLFLLGFIPIFLGINYLSLDKFILLKGMLLACETLAGVAVSTIVKAVCTVRSSESGPGSVI